MTIDFEFYPLTELPRQRELLQSLIPGLVALERTEAVWLTGSLARGDADHWSSVDLHLLLDHKSVESAAPSRPSLEVQNAIRGTVGEACVLIEHNGDSEAAGSLQGIVIEAPSRVDISEDIGPAGVLFEITWALATDVAEMEGLKGAARPLYIAERLDGIDNLASTCSQEAIGPPDVGVIERQLGRFWLLLARLPAAVGRQEQLAAHILLTEMHDLLIDLVVSLNGGSRPTTRARINQFLGPAQREAFERSLGLRRSDRKKGAGGGAKWIGQAVALVVLYRWYAPQLAEKHSLPYPHVAENTVLALLSAEMKNWPASISTG